MKRPSGFLLLEVVVAIAILTGGLLYVARSYASAKNSLKRSVEIYNASLLLKDRMWEFEEKGEVREGVYIGDFTQDPAYAWSLEAKPIKDSGLSLVVLEVHQKKNPQKTRYSITTYLKNKTK